MTQHVRHKEFTPLDRPRELLLVCPALKSQVNLARIVRLASCAGVTKIITTGSTKVDPKIARDGAENIEIVRKRTLLPVLKELKSDGYRIVGLEQTDNSHLIFQYQYHRKTALLIGHERHGILDEELAVTDDCIEIPVYSLPYSYNVVTATTMAVYEYCRQFPCG
jgi:tRNA G18 (ribose-2'-O)-methylase SpoU